MAGITTGKVRWVLRAEGLAIFVAALLAYDMTGRGWPWFALLFLLPDLSLLGYLAGPRVGAVVYNLGHSLIGALTCVLLGWRGLGGPELLPLGLIWCAHIGFDRALGYGLKYAEGFGATHLGRIGRAAQVADPAPER
jgi:hypothetical protein